MFGTNAGEPIKVPGPVILAVPNKKGFGFPLDNPIHIVCNTSFPTARRLLRLELLEVDVDEDATEDVSDDDDDDDDDDPVGYWLILFELTIVCFLFWCVYRGKVVLVFAYRLFAF